MDKVNLRSRLIVILLSFGIFFPSNDGNVSSESPKGNSKDKNKEDKAQSKRLACTDLSGSDDRDDPEVTIIELSEPTKSLKSRQSPEPSSSTTEERLEIQRPDTYASNPAADRRRALVSRLERLLAVSSSRFPFRSC